MSPTQRTWTVVGKEYTEGKEEEIAAAAVEMPWQTMPCEMAMMPGLGIKEAIKQLRLPKVTRVGHSPALAPYGFLGIEANYKNGKAQIFLIDHGDGVVPLFSDFEPKEDA